MNASFRVATVTFHTNPLIHGYKCIIDRYSADWLVFKIIFSSPDFTQLDLTPGSNSDGAVVYEGRRPKKRSLIAQIIGFSLIERPPWWCNYYSLCLKLQTEIHLSGAYSFIKVTGLEYSYMVCMSCGLGFPFSLIACCPSCSDGYLDSRKIASDMEPERWYPLSLHINESSDKDLVITLTISCQKNQRYENARRVPSASWRLLCLAWKQTKEDIVDLCPHACGANVQNFADFSEHASSQATTFASESPPRVFEEQMFSQTKQQ